MLKAAILVPASLSERNSYMVTDDQLACELQHAIVLERSRIARDLHDGVAQQLALALLQLEYLQRLLENEADQPLTAGAGLTPARLSQAAGSVEQGLTPAQLLIQIHKTSAIIQTSLLELRHCISSSVPLPLAQRGFTAALQDLLDSYRSEGWHLCYCCDEQTSVPTQLEIPVYRFLQEALSNIRKHARASHVTIRFRLSSATFIIMVSDDGCGFSSAPTGSPPLENDQHFGLRLMREHIEHLGGRCQLWSLPGQGTTIQVCLPLKCVS
jgi:signal transduction histidine kinase